MNVVTQKSAQPIYKGKMGNYQTPTSNHTQIKLKKTKKQKIKNSHFIMSLLFLLFLLLCLLLLLLRKLRLNSWFPFVFIHSSLIFKQNMDILFNLCILQPIKIIANVCFKQSQNIDYLFTSLEIELCLLFCVFFFACVGVLYLHFVHFAPLKRYQTKIDCFYWLYILRYANIIHTSTYKHEKHAWKQHKWLSINISTKH